MPERVCRWIALAGRVPHPNMSRLNCCRKINSCDLQRDASSVSIALTWVLIALRRASIEFGPGIQTSSLADCGDCSKSNKSISNCLQSYFGQAKCYQGYHMILMLTKECHIYTRSGVFAKEIDPKSKFKEQSFVHGN